MKKYAWMTVAMFALGAPSYAQMIGNRDDQDSTKMGCYDDGTIGRRTRGDGIGTAGDSPLCGAEAAVVAKDHCTIAGDAPRNSADLASGRRTRGDGVGTAGDEPVACQEQRIRRGVQAGDAPDHRVYPDRAVGSRTRGDGIGTAGDEPRLDVDR